jgi:OMF family outer membrane factor
MVRRWRRVPAVLLLPLLVASQPNTAAQTQPQIREAGIRQLESSWRQLDQQLRALDALLPDDLQGLPARNSAIPPLPANLIKANQAPSGSLKPEQAIPAPPLALPTATQLQASGVQGLSLEQSLAIAFASSASLQAQREQVAASLASLQAALGTWWPRISAVASGGSGQSGTWLNAPVGNGNLGFGPQFSPNGLATPGGGTTPGAFYVPSGGGAYLNQSQTQGQAGLELDYTLIDFARTPKIQAVRAQLRNARNTYAANLRSLQLKVSEAYYRLQQADQTVRIRDAAVRNDLLILQDTEDLKRAGLVPRLDVLRRRSIEASDQEQLIQALADRAVARRQLAVLLNLPPQLTPAASDPIAVQPRWPLDLETSLLAAYRGNPELEAILATREALARNSSATAAGLLPKLSLFANAGGSAGNTNQFDATVSNGGCCGATLIPVQNSNGYSWSVGLTLRWLLFDGGTTAGQARALARQADATAQQYAEQRDAIRLRLEQAFFNHEASLAKLASARRGLAAALEAFRDVRLRYQTGLSSELDLSNTQERLIGALVSRLNATVGVNITYAQLLRELLPVPRDPAAPFKPLLQLGPGQLP